MPPANHEITPEELYANPQWGRCELIDGKVIQMSPAGHTHGEVAMNLANVIYNHVKMRGLGKVYAAETGFLFPDGKTVRAPDVMFLSAKRIPTDLPDDGYLPVSPDFAGEVVSPEDNFKDVMAKAESYIAVGVKLVWILDPSGRRIHIYRPGQPVRRVEAGDKLSGEDVLPGLDVDVGALFAI